MILMKDFQTIPLCNNGSCRVTGINDPTASEDILVSNYPNPFVESTTVKFKTKGGHTLIQIIDSLGRVVSTPIDKDYTTPGNYTTSFNSGGLATGVYYARLQNGPVQQVKAMLKVR